MKWLPLLLLAACSVAQAPPPAPIKDDLATVFVPGFKGSFLADEHNQRVWLNPEAALSSGDKSLALPFDGEQANAFGPLHPEGPFTRLRAFVISKDIYLGFLEFGRASLPGFTSFAYDWRQDIRESAAALCQAIDQLPAARVDIVAHSMGGLVAMQCLRSGNAKLRRVVFAGTPFRGSALMFHDLLTGSTTARNSALLSREALFSFPASFQLLPPEGEFQDADAWVRGGWGVFADEAHRKDPAYRAHLEQMLDVHRQSQSAVRGSKNSLTVIGVGNATMSVVSAADPEHPRGADGDGSVLASSAALDGAETFVTHADHVDMLLDAQVQEAIARFLAAK